MEMSESIEELSKAMNKMQAEMEFAVRDVQAYKYKYADLAAIWTVLKDPLTKNGLMVSQDAFTNEKGACVQTLVVHSGSGQWIKSGVLNVPGDKTAHSCGSSLTYGKRYQLTAILGIQIDEDDDGKSAQKESLEKESKPEAEIIPLTDDQMEKWIISQGDRYDRQDIEGFLKARAGYLKHTVNHSASQMKAHPVLFKKDVEKWIAKQEN